MKNTSVFLIWLFLLFIANNVASQSLDSLLRNKRVYYAESIGELPAPRIDGLLDDEIWDLGAWQGDFIQQFPFGGQPSSERSYVKLLYDRSNLYVALVCQDSEPELIRNILGRRDARGGDNAGIAIDSYFDKRTAFEFSMTAAGQKMDLKHLGDYRFDMNWDAVWDGASVLNDTAWIAEMLIPFSQLRYASREEHTWGLHVYRVISRRNEAASWDYIPRTAPAMVYLFGELKGIKEIRSSRQVEFLPYTLGSMTRLAGTDHPDPFDFNLGVDAKVGISSDFTVDLTVNPDFGQVEADPSVLNLTAFETFYAEKRPFFLEGNDVFDFEMDRDIPYYSRRIGSAPSFPGNYGGFSITEIPDRTTILGAVKLTGKTGRGLSVGVVNGLTARETARVEDPAQPDREIEVSPLSNYLASRIKQDINGGNTIVGGVFSLVNRISPETVSHELLPAQAISGGLDFLTQWKERNYFIEAKAIASQLKGSPEAILRQQLAHNHRFQRPDADYLEVDSLMERLLGHGGLIRGGKKGGKWTFFLQGQYRSPGLNLNDMGYIRQSDFIGQRIEVAYDMLEPRRWIRDYQLQFFQDARWSFGGENTGNQLGFSLNLRNNKLWRFRAEGQYDFSTLDIRELRGGPALRLDPVFTMGLSVTSNTAKDFYGTLGAAFSTLGREPSGEEQLNLSFTWLPIRRLSLSTLANVSRHRYHQQYVTTLTGISSKEYIVGNIDRHTASLTFRGELFLTPELSLQYYGSPYYSVGSYDAFKRVDRSQAKPFGERLELLDPDYDPVADRYAFERNTETFGFGNPDFSFMQFRSNLVFRWEYKLGSTLYVVWSHERSGWESDYHPITDITGDLFGLKGSHVLMIKLNFWFSV